MIPIKRGTARRLGLRKPPVITLATPLLTSEATERLRRAVEQLVESNRRRTVRYQDGGFVPKGFVQW